MSASTATKPYTPRILEPRLRTPVAGVRVFLVESHKANEFHRVWVQPDNYIRCDCTAAKYGRECSHKHALAAKLLKERSAKRERAILQNHTPEEFSIFKCSR